MNSAEEDCFIDENWRKQVFFLAAAAWVWSILTTAVFYSGSTYDYDSSGWSHVWGKVVECDFGFFLALSI